jgi:hypothetical protein
MPHAKTRPWARRPAAVRFWEKVEKSDGCWNWKGATIKGYGAFQRDTYRTVRAHRFSYETNIGLIPEGLCVCHFCDNPLCVNPAHLFLGTHKDNSDDKWAKGRGNRVPYGNGALNAAKTHCSRGHPLSGSNLHILPRGHRRCRECHRMRDRRRDAKRRSELSTT